MKVIVTISVFLLIGLYIFLGIFGVKRAKKIEEEFKKRRKEIHEEVAKLEEKEKKEKLKSLMNDFIEKQREYDALIEQARQKSDAERIKYNKLVRDLEEEFKRKKQYETEQFNLILEQDKRYLDQQKERDTQIIEENKKQIQRELEVYRQLSEERILNGFKELKAIEQKKFEDFLNEIAVSKETQLSNMANQISIMNEEIEFKKKELQEYQDKVAAANEAFRLQQLTEKEWEAHHLILTEHQKSIIDKLLMIGEDFPEVRESLRKIIWSDFLLKSLNEMIKRQFGAESPCNIIYCIEDSNGKYIGKTAQTARKRWEEHIKTSLEIGKTPQKIHRAMYKKWGDFSFSVLDKCTAEELSDRERYWIDFYGSKDYGYNMKG